MSRTLDVRKPRSQVAPVATRLYDRSGTQIDMCCDPMMKADLANSSFTFFLFWSRDMLDDFHFFLGTSLRGSAWWSGTLEDCVSTRFALRLGSNSLLYTCSFDALLFNHDSFAVGDGWRSLPTIVPS